MELFLKIIKKSYIARFLLLSTLEVIQVQSLLVNSLKKLKNSLHKIEKCCYKNEKNIENGYEHVHQHNIVYL